MVPIRDHNPSGRVAYVTYALIALNVGIFISYWPMFDNARQLGQFYTEWAMTPRLISMGENYKGIITSMFLHGGWMHLAGNMLFLFIFGDNMEDEMGHLGFSVFYLLSGIGAALAQYIIDTNSGVPVVGASGAIAGVMGGYLLMFPKARVDIFIFFIIIFKIIPVPAWLMLALWFGIQLFGGLGSGTVGGGVAYWAHAGGFVIGLILTVPLWLRRGGPAFWNETDMTPPHPEAEYKLERSSIPKVGRK